LRARAAWWVFESHAPDEARTQAEMAHWRALADARVPSADIRSSPELDAHQLTELALTEDIDLLVVGPQTRAMLPALGEVGRRLALGLLFLHGAPRTGPIERVWCVPFGRGARSAIAAFLRDHTGDGMRVTIRGAAPRAHDVQ